MRTLRHQYNGKIKQPSRLNDYKCCFLCLQMFCQISVVRTSVCAHMDAIAVLAFRALYRTLQNKKNELI